MLLTFCYHVHFEEFLITDGKKISIESNLLLASQLMFSFLKAVLLSSPVSSAVTMYRSVLFIGIFVQIRKSWVVQRNTFEN